MMKSASLVHRNHRYEKLQHVTGVRQETRSLSLPNALGCSPHNGLQLFSADDEKLLNVEADVSAAVSSPVHDSWFNTWPERCDKPKCETAVSAAASCNGRALTLNEALRNISLAYNPVTKQLHLMHDCGMTVIDNSDDAKSVCKEDEVDFNSSNNHFVNGRTLGHRRNADCGSFSSTHSQTLSDPSPSGSLLESDDCCSLNDVEHDTGRRRKLSSFLQKNVFSWKSNFMSPSSTASLWKFFNKSSENHVHSTSSSGSPQHGVVSSTALIPNMRPSHLPAKTEEEEMRHREEYKAMLAAAKKKEALSSAARQKQQKLQLQQEEQQAQAAKHFVQRVLKNWDATRNARRTKDLWWHGLPSSVRGRVWRMAIANELNLTQTLFDICVSRARSRLANNNGVLGEADQESSMDVIQLDISRTFPSLGIFQEGGPYSHVLHSLLAAYVCYRPDVGYVQGMSYIAAILILNMDEFEAFVCFANLLNGPLLMAAFTLNQQQMQAYYSAYNEIFNYNLPKLYNHFACSGLTPDLYLHDWIYTIFAKAMPLDIACRVWDLFLRDGDEFLFRTALGVLHLNQDVLLKMDFLHGAQFLTHLPEDLPVDELFKSIHIINTGIGKLTFSQIVDKCSNHKVCEHR